MAEAFSELAMHLKTAGREHASSAGSTVQNSLIVGVYARCIYSREGERYSVTERDRDWEEELCVKVKLCGHVWS